MEQQKKKNAKTKAPLLTFASEEKLPRKIAKNCQLPAKGTFGGVKFGKEKVASRILVGARHVFQM